MGGVVKKIQSKFTEIRPLINPTTLLLPPPSGKKTKFCFHNEDLCISLTTCPRTLKFLFNTELLKHCKH